MANLYYTFMFACVAEVSRLTAGPLPSFNGTNGFLPNSLSGTVPMSVEPVSAQPLQSSLLAQQAAEGFYPGPAVTSGQNGVPVQQSFQPGNLSGLNVGQIGMPPIPTTSGQTGLYHSGSPGQNGSAGSDISFDEEAYADRQHTNGNSWRTNSKLHAKDTKTKRNPKQQMQNKQAQQRYR